MRRIYVALLFLLPVIICEANEHNEIDIAYCEYLHEMSQASYNAVNIFGSGIKKEKSIYLKDRANKLRDIFRNKVGFPVSEVSLKRPNVYQWLQCEKYGLVKRII